MVIDEKMEIQRTISDIDDSQEISLYWQYHLYANVNAKHADWKELNNKTRKLELRILKQISRNIFKW